MVICSSKGTVTECANPMPSDNNPAHTDRKVEVG
jgi:hypothetical protein